MTLGLAERKYFTDLNNQFNGLLVPIISVGQPTQQTICHSIAQYQFYNLEIRLKLQYSKIALVLREIKEKYDEIIKASQRSFSFVITGHNEYLNKRRFLLDQKIEEAKKEIALRNEINALEKEKDALCLLIMTLVDLDQHLRARYLSVKASTASIIANFQATSSNLYNEVMNTLYQNYQQMQSFQITQLNDHKGTIQDLQRTAEAQRNALITDCDNLTRQLGLFQTQVTNISTKYTSIQSTTDLPFPIASILSEPLLSEEKVPTAGSILFIEKDEIHIKNFSNSDLSLDNHSLVSYFRNDDGFVKTYQMDLSGSIPAGGFTPIHRTREETFQWSSHNYWIELYKKVGYSSVTVTRIHNITISSHNLPSNPPPRNIPSSPVVPPGHYSFTPSPTSRNSWLDIPSTPPSDESTRSNQ
jgi:hypothetical protein